MSLHWLGTLVHTEHDVDEDQFEPGLAADQQAHAHGLDFVLMDWNVSAALGMTDWFEAEVALPVRLISIEPHFLDTSGAEIPGFSSIHHRKETLFGIGDLSLTGRFRAVSARLVPRWTLDVRAGVSFPTGRTEPNPFDLGRRGESHQHMFFGTGSLDPIVGIETSYAFDALLVFGWTSMKAPLYENEHGYRGPMQVAGGLGVETGFGLDMWRFGVGPEVYHEEAATWSGEPAENSGRTDLIATAGVHYMPSPSWDIHLLAKVPWTVRAEGGQLKTPFLAVLGVSYAMPLWGSGE